MESKTDSAPAPASPPAPSATPEPAAAPVHGMEFLRESADEQARYLRARDENVEVLVAFLSDGRLRVADAEQRRFAGMLQNEKADLIDLDADQWSSVYLRLAPDGTTQLEFHGGPYDARVLTCEALAE